MHIYRSASTSMLKHASFLVGESTAADWLLARQCSAALYITQHRATIIIIIINATWEHVGSSQAQSARRKPLSLGRTSAPKPREPESASNDRTQVQSGIVVPCINYPARKDPYQGEARRPTKWSTPAETQPSTGSLAQRDQTQGRARRPTKCGQLKQRLPRPQIGREGRVKRRTALLACLSQHAAVKTT